MAKPAARSRMSVRDLVNCVSELKHTKLINNALTSLGRLCVLIIITVFAVLVSYVKL